MRQAVETKAPHTVCPLKVERDRVTLRHRRKRGKERGVEHGNLRNPGSEYSAAKRHPVQRDRQMKGCQLSQSEQSLLRGRVDQTRRGKRDSAVHDSMSHCPHVTDRILREKAAEHCIEASRTGFIRQ